MSNPWKTINLTDYENHMSLESVFQLQTMEHMMRDQLLRYSPSTAMILGIAGGNGLKHVKLGGFHKLYGVDINSDYLTECADRYEELGSIFEPVLADLTDDRTLLPSAELVIANLLIEYIGYGDFKRTIKQVSPKWLSCIIQVNLDENGFVSDSPYLHAFDALNEVHQEITPDELSKNMVQIGYELIFTEEQELPNDKKLIRLDYKRSEYERK